MKRGIVLFGHGARDPAWREPMDAVAQRVQRLAPDAAVACAFLELQAPSLQDAARALVEGGVGAITVFPMFLGVGRHAREDLPRLVDALRNAHPAVDVRVLPPAGEHPALLDLLARIASDSTS